MPSLGPDELQLWRIDLDRPDAGSEHIVAVLSLEERRRAFRFRSAVDARRWMLSRAALRAILGGHLGIGPSEVSFVLRPGGKPALAGDAAGRVRFNLSHSGGMALVGVSSGHEVGVDVERIRGDLDETALARLALGARAVELLEAAEPERRVAAFFRLWVRHEASIKCRGVGLGEGQPAGDDGVVVDDVAIGDGYAAAVAVAVGVERAGRWDPGLVSHWSWDAPEWAGPPGGGGARASGEWSWASG